MMDIYCSSCGCFFKDWSAGERVCCGSTMKELVEMPKAEFTPSKFKHYVIEDIKPYQAMGVDAKTGAAPMITSRREHREYLKRNGYVEIGNEKLPEKKYEADHNVRNELTQATHEVMRKYR